MIEYCQHCGRAYERHRGVYRVHPCGAKATACACRRGFDLGPEPLEPGAMDCVQILAATRAALNHDKLPLEDRMEW